MDHLFVTDEPISSLSTNLQKEMEHLRSIKDELQDLKLESRKLSRNRSEYTKLDIYQNSVFQNLEAQVESLKEELQSESALRMRVEEELKCVLDDLNFYKNASKSDLATRQINEIRQHYDAILYRINNEPSKQATGDKDAASHGIREAVNDYDDCSEEEPIGRNSIGDNRKVNENFEEVQLRYLDAMQLVKELEQKLFDLQQRYDASCQMAKESFEKISESLELAKTAADERDAATLARNDAEHELKRLQQVIERLVEQAGQRTAEEVEKVREQANLNITKLLEELQTTEQERTKLEYELEHLKSTRSNLDLGDSFRNNKLDPRLESVLQRAHQAEQQRDEFKLRLEKAEASHERAVAAKQNELQLLQDELKSLMERLEFAESQRTAMEDRFKRQMEVLRNTENQALEAKRQANAAQRSALQQVLLANQTVELHDSEAKRRLEAVEKANQSSIQRWQEMLTKQHTLATKWRSEAEQLADQLEQQGAALREEIENERTRANQLSRRIVLLERWRNAQVETYQSSMRAASQMIHGDS